MARCSCSTCRDFAAFYADRVLFLVTREGDEVHVGVDELTETELARFSANGRDAEKAEIVDWLGESAAQAVTSVSLETRGDSGARAA